MLNAEEEATHLDVDQQIPWSVKKIGNLESYKRREMKRKEFY